MHIKNKNYQEQNNIPVAENLYHESLAKKDRDEADKKTAEYLSEGIMKIVKNLRENTSNTEKAQEVLDIILNEHLDLIENHENLLKTPLKLLIRAITA